jgi:hypothetical protein
MQTRVHTAQSHCHSVNSCLHLLDRTHLSVYATKYQNNGIRSLHTLKASTSYLRHRSLERKFAYHT